MFRQNALAAPVQIGAAWLLRNRRWYLPALLMMLSAGALTFPWAVRNYQVGGIFSPVSAIRGFRYTYYRDMLDADDRLNGRPLYSIRDAEVDAALDSVNEKYGVGRRYVGDVLNEGVVLGTVAQTQQMVVEVDRIYGEAASRMGWGRIMALRLGYFLPGLWVTRPDSYPARVWAPLRYGLAGIQVLIVCIGVLAIRSAFRLRLAWTLVGLLALSALEVAYQGAGMVTGAVVLAFLSNRAGAGDREVAVWAALVTLLTVTLAGWHAEFRYVMPHYPLLLGLAVWESGRWTSRPEIAGTV